MRVYLPVGDDNAQLCHPIAPAEFRSIFDQVTGVPMRGRWKPIPVEIVHEDEGARLGYSDAPWIGPIVLVLRAAAAEKLRPLLEREGELLPLRCAEDLLVVFNPTVVIDALDETNSTLRRYSNGRVMRIEQYVFRPDVVARHFAFKISSLFPAGPTFVTDRFVEAWRSAGIVGVHFDLLWEG